MNPLNAFHLPDHLHAAVLSFAKGFGINEDAAPLILLQLCGAIAGSSVNTLSPDLVHCTPGFELAAIHDGRAMLRGATLSAVDGARLELMEALAEFASTPRKECRSEAERLRARHQEILNRIAALETEIEKCPPADSTQEAVNRIMRNPSFYSQLPSYEKELAALDEELPLVEKTLVDLKLALSPEVIRDNGSWSDLIDENIHAFDRHFLQIQDASSLLAELRSRSNRLKDCREALLRARSESPVTGFNSKDSGIRPCVHLYGTTEEFSNALRQLHARKLGLLDHFVFIEADSGESPDPESLMQFGESEWHKMMWRVLRRRAAGQTEQLRCDLAGLKSYIEFRNWCSDFMKQLPAERRASFLRWPELMIRLATGMAIITDRTSDGILPVEFITSASGLLKHHARQQAAILARLAGRFPDQSRDEIEIAGLVHRLRSKGPQTRRDLVRSFSGQNYNVIDARIFMAVRAGAIFQSSDGLFHAVDDNVNVSTHGNTTENEGVVAA